MEERPMAVKGILGLVGVLALAGLTAAEPPVNPLVEGRETDPVAREFHLPEKPLCGYVSGPVVPERSNPGAWVAIMAGICDVLFDRFTVPLGTAVMEEGRADGV
jgi:hypothetical protein